MTLPFDNFGIQWYYFRMNVAKVTISLSPDMLQNLDRLVSANHYSTRSQAVQAAVQEKLNRLKTTRLYEECKKLDMMEEQAFAEEGVAHETNQWPIY